MPIKEVFMGSTTWQSGSVTSVFTTEMNSLANGQKVVSSEIDNSINPYLFNDAELYLESFPLAPSSQGLIELYIIQSIDGINYEDGGATLNPSASNLVGIFQIIPSINAQRKTIKNISVPPFKFKYILINKTGVVLASSGNTLKIAPYSYKAL